MNSAHLNPPPPPPSPSFPFVELKEEQQQLFLSRHQVSGSSVSGPTFLDSTQECRREFNKLGGSQVLEFKGGSRDHNLLSSSVFRGLVNDTSHVDHNKFLLLSKRSEEEEHEASCNGDGSVKWMRSKMSLIPKTSNSSSSCLKNDKTTTAHYHHLYNTNNNECKSSNSSSSSNNQTVRVCSDCNTTTTPLWRSGPRGPKSLCNACGIRQRKARRAMAEAAAAAAAGIAMEASSAKVNNKILHKEKKWRTSQHFVQCKKSCKPLDPIPQTTHKKLSFKNLALNLSKNSSLQHVLTRDVEEAAVLLMELSCGFIPN